MLPDVAAREARRKQDRDWTLFPAARDWNRAFRQWQGPGPIPDEIHKAILAKHQAMDPLEMFGLA